MDHHHHHHGSTVTPFCTNILQYFCCVITLLLLLLLASFILTILITFIWMEQKKICYNNVTFSFCFVSAIDNKKNVALVPVRAFVLTYNEKLNNVFSIFTAKKRLLEGKIFISACVWSKCFNSVLNFLFSLKFIN